jgi:hypothetical protein
MSKLYVAICGDLNINSCRSILVYEASNGYITQSLHLQCSRNLLAFDDTKHFAVFDPMRQFTEIFKNKLLLTPDLEAIEDIIGGQNGQLIFSNHPAHLSILDALLETNLSLPTLGEK